MKTRTRTTEHTTPRGRQTSSRAARAVRATVALAAAAMSLAAAAPAATAAGDVSGWRDGNLRGATWDDGLLLVQPSVEGWCTGEGVDGLVHEVDAASGLFISNGVSDGPRPVAIYEAPGDTPETVVGAFRARWCPVIAAGGDGPQAIMTGEAATRSIISSDADGLRVNVHSQGWVAGEDGARYELRSQLQLTVTFRPDGPPLEEAKVSTITLR